MLCSVYLNANLNTTAAHKINDMDPPPASNTPSVIGRALVRFHPCVKTPQHLFPTLSQHIKRVNSLSSNNKICVT